MRTIKKWSLTIKVLLTAMFISAGVSAQNGPEIEFDKMVFDYGTISTSHDGNSVFTFTNTGDAPLILSNAKPSCNCTVPAWPKEPIKPGETGQIKVHYNTKRVGPINKSITITSNATNSPTTVVRIKGTVKAEPTYEKSKAGPFSK